MSVNNGSERRAMYNVRVSETVADTVRRINSPIAALEK